MHNSSAHRNSINKPNLPQTVTTPIQSNPAPKAAYNDRRQTDARTSKKLATSSKSGDGHQNFARDKQGKWLNYNPSFDANDQPKVSREQKDYLGKPIQ